MTFTLTATHTLAALASAATSVTITVCGDEILTAGSTTTDSFKTLDQRQVPSSATVIYTVPSSCQTVVKTIALANTTGAGVTVTLFVDGLVDANRVVRLVVPANGSAYWTSEGWQVLDSTGTVLVTSTVTLTGDVTGTGIGTVPTILATVNSNVGSFGSATNVAQVTVNAKGLATAAANVPIQILPAAVTGFDTQVRTNRLDQMATPTANVSMGGFKVTNGADATNATDLTTFQQVQAIAEGRADKDAVDWTTTAPITLSGLGTQAGGEWTSTLAGTERILVKDQASSSADGLYTPAAGAWTRTLDANTGTEITNATVLVRQGATSKGDTWRQSATVVTIGTDPQTWIQIGEGDPITLSAVGAAPNANAATLAGQALTLQPASASFPGVITAAQFTKLANTSGTNTGDQSYTASGDATAPASASNLALTLATVNANVGSFGSASSVMTQTVNAKGLTTAAASVPIVISPAAVTGLTFFATLANLSGDVTTAGTGATTLATVNSNVGSFGTATAVGTFTVDGKGRITAASATAIQITEAQVTNLVSDLAGKQPTGNYLTALTGDGTASGPGSAAFTLSTVNAGVGSFGTATQVPSITVNAKGLVTAAANTAIQIAESQVTNLVSDLAGKQPTGNYVTSLTGDVTGSGPGAAATTLATVNGNVGSFGTASNVGQFTVNAKGLTTAAANVPIVIAESAVTNLVTDLAGKQATGNYITALTGDVTATGPGSVAGTLATVNSNVGSFGSGTQVGVFIVNAKGLTTAASNVAIPSATTTAAGFMSAVDKIRMGQVVDAQADLGFVGDLITTNSTTSASTGTPTTITDSANPFQPFAGNLNYYVGKRITLAGAGASGAVYVGTITAVGGAGTITVTPAISTTVTNRIASFGTDNTAAVTALNTLVNTTKAPFPGTKIMFGNSATNAYGFPTPVLLNQTVLVEGVGGGHTADTGDYSRIGGTRLAWWGTSPDGGVAFGAFWTISPTGVQSIKKPSLRHCWLDCRNGDQNNALIGLKLASCQGWGLDDFFVMDPMAIGIWFDVATSPTEARDCTRGLATNLGFRCLDNTSGPVAVTLTPTTTTSAVNIATAQSLTLAAANGLRAGSDYIWVQTIIGKPTLARYTGGGGGTTLTGVICSAEDAFNAPTTAAGSNVVQASPSNSTAIYLNGGTGANTCCNTFIEVAISHGGSWGPGAVEFGNSDSNDLQSVYVNGGTRAVFGAAPNNRQTKPGVRMNGSNTSASLASRNNTFKGGDPGSLPTTNGGAEFMGALNTGAMMLAPSGPSYWELHQMGNGAPVPTVELGASLFWSGNGMFREGGLGSLTANQVLTAAVANVVNGCSAVVPPQGWQVGLRFNWKVLLSKTAVGIAWTANIRQHSSLTAGGGTLIATAAFTATAAVDEGGLEIELVCTARGGAATALARYRAFHNGGTTAALAGLYTGAAVPAIVPVLGATSQAAASFEGVMTMAGFNGDAPAGGPTFLFLEIVPTTAATVMTVLPPSGLTCIKAANP